MRGKVRSQSVAVLLLLVVVGAACGPGEEHTSPSGQATGSSVHTVAAGQQSVSDLARQAVQLRTALEELLGQHTFLTVNAMRSRVRGDLDFAQATVTAVSRNTDDLTRLLTSVYGPQPGEQFRELWANHVLSLVDYAGAVDRRDRAGQANARRELDEYVGGIAGFLQSATRGAVSAPAVNAAIGMHVDHLLTATDAYAARDYTKAYAVERADYMHMFGLATSLAAGIAKGRGGGVPADFDSPVRRLRSALGRLLGEHYELTVDAMRAGASRSPDLRPAADLVNANTRDLAGAFDVLFGRKSAEQFTALWADHVDALMSYTAALRAGDQRGQAAARAQLTRFEQQLATFLATGTQGRLSAPAVAQSLSMHDRQLLDQIDAYAAPDYAKAHNLSFEGYQHMFDTADALATAVGPTVAARLPRGGVSTGGGGVLAALLLAAVGAASIALDVVRLRAHLAPARSQVAALREALVTGDVVTARGRLAELRRLAQGAHESTTGPAWWLAAHIPVAGRTFETTRGLAAALDTLVSEPLPALLGVADELRPERVFVGNRIRVDDLVRARGPLAAAHTEVAGVLGHVRRLPSSGVVGQVAAARADLVTQLGALERALAGASDAADIGPGMLGGNGRRAYLLAFQNNAEVKGTGGLIGVYGILDADRGRVGLAHLGSDNELRNSPQPVVDLGPEYAANYGPMFGASFWLNANLSPHFPYAAQVWRALYERQSRSRVDGVVALDPPGLARVLAATGPVRLADGQTVSQYDVVRLVEVDAYARYDERTRREARKGFLQQVAKAAFDAVLAGQGSRRDLLRELAKAAQERHLQVWSARPQEQRRLARPGFTGELYQGPAPFVAAVLNNTAGAKLEYYLDRTLRYDLGRPSGRTRPARIAFTMTNRAPVAQLPAYVTDRVDAPTGSYPRGQSALTLSVYLTQGARLVRAELAGRPVQVAAATERGHPRVTLPVRLDPGRPRTLVLDVVEPVRPERPRVLVQPMASAQDTHVSTRPG